MAAVNFEERCHHFSGLVTCFVVPQPKELRTYNNNNTNGLPYLVLQFHIVTQHDVWRKLPDNPSQLIHLAESQRYETKSFDLKLCPFQYTSYDVLYSVLEENLNNWGDYYESYNGTLIRGIIRHIHKNVDHELNNSGGCEYLELNVKLNLKMEYVLDGRLQGMPSWHLNGGMVPASKASIMQLPERMEIDGDQCLNDNDCVICLEQLGKEEGKRSCACLVRICFMEIALQPG